MAHPRFHTIIVLRERDEWIEACLGSLYSQTMPPAQVTVFQNGVRSAVSHTVKYRFPDVRLMRSDEPLSLGAAVNRAAASVRDAQCVLLLDPEAILALGALERLADGLAQHATAGIIGCKVLDGDVETIHHVGLRLRGNGLPEPVGQGELDRGQFHGMHDALTVQMGALAIRSEVWCELGGLDEQFAPSFFERIDLCLRCWLSGWTVSVAGDATVTHFGVPEGRYFWPGEGDAFFTNRTRLLKKHYRTGDWFRKFWPEEVAWMLGLRKGLPARGNRSRALRTLLRTWAE